MFHVKQFLPYGYFGPFCLVWEQLAALCRCLCVCFTVLGVPIGLFVVWFCASDVQSDTPDDRSENERWQEGWIYWIRADQKHGRDYGKTIENQFCVFYYIKWAIKRLSIAFNRAVCVHWLEQFAPKRLIFAENIENEKCNFYNFATKGAPL